jgi:hypothetical protein
MDTEKAASYKLKVTSYKFTTFNFQPSTFNSFILCLSVAKSRASFAVSPKQIPLDSLSSVLKLVVMNRLENGTANEHRRKEPQMNTDKHRFDI